MNKQSYMLNTRERRLYESIMRNITPRLNKMLREMDECGDDMVSEEDELSEDELNELFGFGGPSVDKPEKQLSLDNSDEENAELAMQWMHYFLVKSKNKVKDALTKFFESLGSGIAVAPKALFKGLLMVLSASVKGITFSATAVAGLVAGTIFALCRLVNMGVKNAAYILSKTYEKLSEKLTDFYKGFKSKTEQFVVSSKSVFERYIGALTGALSVFAAKAEGAAEYLKDLFVGILKDAKDGVTAAVLCAKTWISSKSEEVKTWIVDTVGDIKQQLVKTWNDMEKSVRKAYNKIAETLQDWMTSLQDAVQYAKEKVKEVATNTKNFVVDKKDKALLFAMQKAIKGLSDNYTEDQVVAIVRKCFEKAEQNESLRPMFNGNYLINEKYFYNKAQRRMRSLNEHRRH